MYFPFPTPTSSSDLILTLLHNYIHQEEKKVFEKKKNNETHYPTTPLSSSPSSQPLLFNPPSPLPPTPPTATTHCRFSPNAQWNPLQHTSLLDAKSQPSTLRSRLALSLWSFRNSNCQSHRKHRFGRFSVHRSQFDCFDGESDYAWYVTYTKHIQNMYIYKKDNKHKPHF